MARDRSVAARTLTPARDERFAMAEELLLQLTVVQEVLTDTASAAAATVGRCCGITYRSNFGVLTVASSDATANAVDELQYSAGQGPCLQALRTGQPVRVDDVLTENRWDRYGRFAAEAGVRASLSYPVLIAGESVGALNVYSVEPTSWDAADEAETLLMSNRVADILGTVRGMAATVVADPATAAGLQARHTLDLATGMIMATEGCRADAALDALERRAADRGVTVGKLAEELTEQPVSGTPDDGPLAAAEPL